MENDGLLEFGITSVENLRKLFMGTVNVVLDLCRGNGEEKRGKSCRAVNQAPLQDVQEN